METSKLILILIIYTAVLLLVVFYLYPFGKKLFRHKISIRIQIGTKEKEQKEAEEQKEPAVELKEPEKFPSVLGKSTFVLCQPLPHAATVSETENRTKKEDTFVPETEKSEDETVNYETGEGVEIPEEEKDVQAPNVDLNDEGKEFEGSDIQAEASGVDFRELGQTAKTVSNPKSSSPSDEELAGKVLSENRYTDLVKSMQNSRPEYSKRITQLIDGFDQKLAEKQNAEMKPGRKKQRLYESEDFKNFSIDQIS
jgi:flagellar basal body-associated protein FliL